MEGSEWNVSARFPLTPSLPSHSAPAFCQGGGNGARVASRSGVFEAAMLPSKEFSRKGRGKRRGLFRIEKVWWGTSGFPAGPAFPSFLARNCHVGQGGKGGRSEGIRRKGENGGWDPPPPGQSEGGFPQAGCWRAFSVPASAPVVPPLSLACSLVLTSPSYLWASQGGRGWVRLSSKEPSWGTRAARCFCAPAFAQLLNPSVPFRIRILY